MSDTNYYYGHGRGAIGNFSTTTGLPLIFDIGLDEIDELTLDFSAEKVEHESKRQSLASIDLSVVRKVGVTGKLITSISTPDLLKLGTNGTKASVGGGSSGPTAYASGIVNNDIVAHPSGKTRLSSIVITDSTPITPQTMTLGTHYEVFDANAGLIKFLDVNGTNPLQPFKITATEAVGTSVGFMNQRIYERCLWFGGINIADNDKPCAVKLHKIQIEPMKNWQLLGTGNDVNKIEIGFTALKQTIFAPSTTLGQYGDYTESNG